MSDKELKDIANVLRKDVLQMTTAAGSGHPTTCMSCAEIMSALFFSQMRYDTANADNPDNDEFVLSKGHAAPILYAALARAGAVRDNILTLRKFDSVLEGHPIPSQNLEWIKVASGSLGQGLAVGCGMALAAKLQKRSFMTYVLIGDGESAEGSIWESAAFAAQYKLNNLVAVFDINRLGQSGQTMYGHDLNAYKKRLAAYGWKAIAIDGHNIRQILSALSQASKSSKPTAIIAKTFKGKGVSFLENKEGWHGRALSKEEFDKAIKELPNVMMPKVTIKKPAAKKSPAKKEIKQISTNYQSTEMVATRQAFGSALAKLAKQSDSILSVDGDVKNSTGSIEIMKSSPKQMIECYIAEQNMIGVSLGLSKKGYNVFASTFAAFLTRAHDQIRMSALSQANMTVVGSHCGVSIGEDGASQMGLDDLAMFRAQPDSIVLYPSDAVSAEKLTYLAACTQGLKYIRTTRPKTPILYRNDERFELGDYKILKSSREDNIVVAAAGITVFEALKAYDELKKSGINACIVDIYSVKPFNSAKFIALASMKGRKVVTVEDHYAEGGIGEMIASVAGNTEINVVNLAVRKIPHSGKPDELMKAYGIDKSAIAAAVKSLVKR